MKYGLLWTSMLAAVLCTAQSAGQAPPSDEAKSLAKKFAEQGKGLFERGDYAGAAAAYEEAEKHYAAPTIVWRHAVTLEKLGKLVEARKLCVDLAAEPRAANDPTAFWEAQKNAKENIPLLDSRIPKLEIVLSNPPAGTSVSLGERSLGLESLSKPLQLNPGTYDLVVVVPDASKVTRRIVLNEAASERVVVDLAQRPTTPTAASATAAPKPPAMPSSTAPIVPPPSAPTGSRSVLGPAIAFGVGGAGLVAGIVTGSMTIAKVGEIRTLCGEDLVCPEHTKSAVGLEAAKGIGYVATAAFALAGAGAIAGTLLLTIPTKKAAGSSSALVIGPGFVGVRGAFQ